MAQHGHNYSNHVSYDFPTIFHNWTILWETQRLPQCVWICKRYFWGTCKPCNVQGWESVCWGVLGSSNGAPMGGRMEKIVDAICCYLLISFYENSIWIIGWKAPGIILINLGLITFRFYYERDQNLNKSWFLDFWTYYWWLISCFTPMFDNLVK